MKNSISIIFFAATIIFSAQSCTGDGKKSDADSVDVSQPGAQISASVDGKLLYETNCLMCHGSDGQAGTMGAFDLSSSKMDHAATATVIQNGRNGMRPYKEDFNAEQLEAVVKYIEGFRK